MMISVLLHDELNHPPKPIGSEYHPRLPSDSNVKKKKILFMFFFFVYGFLLHHFLCCGAARDNEDVWFGFGGQGRIRRALETEGDLSPCSYIKICME